MPVDMSSNMLTIKKSINKSNDMPAVQKTAEEYEQEIQKLDSYVNALMDGAFSYALLLDHEGKILYFSNNLLALAGLTDGSAFIGMPMLDACKYFKDTNFVEDATRRFSRIMSGENDFYEDDTVIWPSGEKRIYRIHYRCITDTNTGNNSIFICAHDITDLRLEEAEQRINELLYSTALPSLIWDKNGDVMAYNCIAATSFGIPQGLSPVDFNNFLLSIQPKYQPDGTETEVLRRSVFGKALKDGFSHATVRLYKADGTPIFFAVNATRISWLFEQRLVVYLNDLTEIMKKAAEVKASEQKMQEIAARERKAEIQREAAHAANAAKSRFIANMSHEIRTPMNSIIGFSELAMDDEISPKTKEYLRKIMVNSTGLLQIINDLLDISKIESGRMEFENIPFDLQDVFNLCKTSVEPKAMENGVALLISAEPFVGKKLIGDPTRLRQVLMNLLSNAVKFTNAGTVKLTSAVISTTRSGVVIGFEVTDNGIGMSPEQIKRIFEPFVQADSSMTRKYGGTGLGLAITENILKLLGSGLKVESTVGVGSTFRFDLTFDTIDIQSEPLESENNELLLSRPMFNGEILICEDNRMNQRVLSEHLTRIGLQVDIADNGKECVDKVKNRIANGDRQYDLIFMDIHMPVMDGLEAASLLRQMEMSTPVIAMTADIKTHDKGFYESFGMDGCVGKPFTAQQLWRCLLKYLEPASFDITEHNRQKHGADKLMVQLRVDFALSNQKKYNEICEAIDAGDRKLAYRLAHTLKSNAGLIGAIALQKAAAGIEDLLRSEEYGVPVSQLRELKLQLDIVLEGLSPLLSSKDTHETEIVVLGSESIRKVIEKLEPLLELGNTECLSFVDILRSVPNSGELVQQLEDFDFIPAVKTLAELKKVWI